MIVQQRVHVRHERLRQLRRHDVPQARNRQRRLRGIRRRQILLQQIRNQQHHVRVVPKTLTRRQVSDSLILDVRRRHQFHHVKRRPVHRIPERVQVRRLFDRHRFRPDVRAHHLRPYVAQAFIYKLLLRILVTANARDHVSQRFLKQPHRRRLRLVRRAQRSEPRHARARASRHRASPRAPRRAVPRRRRRLRTNGVRALRFASSIRVRVDRSSRSIARPSVAREERSRAIAARSRVRRRARVCRARSAAVASRVARAQYMDIQAPNILYTIPYNNSHVTHTSTSSAPPSRNARRDVERDARPGRTLNPYSFRSSNT